MGWVIVRETLQSQYLVTQPKRQLVWLTTNFSERSTYSPPDGWSLVDAVVHPSGEVSAVVINLEFDRSNFFQIKILRFETDGSMMELPLESLPLVGSPIRFFPASLDRIRLAAFREDVYVVSRGQYNEVVASRVGLFNDQLQVKWQTLVEPDAYAGSIGIIGGGYDNFRQGDRYFYVYADVDELGNLYVAVPSHEDLLVSHDAYFQENLMAETNPGAFDWGVAVLTRVSASGERQYARLAGRLLNKRLINMRVGNGKIYLSGRVKTGTGPGDWDAWILVSDATTGITLFDKGIHVEAGDMFWDAKPMNNGTIVAVGTKAYVQNPSGLSVSDSRLALALLLDSQGNILSELDLPQGPAQRGSEAVCFEVLNHKQVIIAGVHDAPGTHAPVYCDGFITIQDIIEE